MDVVRGAVLEDRHHAGQHAQVAGTVDDDDEVAGRLGAALAGDAHAQVERRRRPRAGARGGESSVLPNIAGTRPAGCACGSHCAHAHASASASSQRIMISASRGERSVANEREHRAGDAAGRVGRAGDADDALAQVGGHGHGRDADARRDRAVLAPALEPHVECDLGDADAQEQRVLIATASLPEPRRRRRRDVGDDDRIGKPVPRLDALDAGELGDATSGGLHVVDPLALGLQPLSLGHAPVGHERADDHDGAGRRHQQHDRAAEDDRHRHAEHHGDDRRQPRHRRLVGVGGLVAGQLHDGLLLCRADARGSIESAGAERVASEVGVGHRGDADAQHAVAELQQVGGDERRRAPRPLRRSPRSAGRGRPASRWR